MEFVKLDKVHQGRFISRYDITYRTPSGREKVYEMISRDPDLRQQADIWRRPVHAVALIITDESGDLADLVVYHSGTKLEGDRLLTSGGRVLGVTGLGPDLARAIEKAYQGVERIHFSNKYYRRDIGQRALSAIRQSKEEA